MCHAFTVKRKTRRWPVAQFYNIIDVCGIAAKVIWLNLYPNWNQTKLNSRRKLFLKDLVKGLVIPNIERRSKLFLSKSNVAAVDQILGHASPPHRRLQDHQIRDDAVTAARMKKDDLPNNAAVYARNMYICNEHSQKTVACITCINK